MPVTVFDETMRGAVGSGRVLAAVQERRRCRRSSRRSKVDLEARLSESPEIRRGLAEQARAQLQAAGAAESEGACALCLQAGLSLADRAGDSRAEGQERARREDQGRRVQSDLSKKYKFYMVPSRWVHELYPVDEMFQRDLGIAKDAFSDRARRQSERHLHGRSDRRGGQSHPSHATFSRRRSSASISTSSPAGRA